MATTLASRICEQMRTRSTDQLLQIWTANDRDVWSPDAFAAIKAILTERHVPIPSQNAPISNVPPAEPAVDPFWLRWLRIVLIAGLVIAGVELLVGVNLIISQIQDRNNPRWPGGTVALEWIDWIIAEHTINVGMPLMLLLSICLCWRRTIASRRAMIAYSWIAIGLSSLMIFRTLYRVVFAHSWFRFEVSNIEHAVHMAVYPLVVLLFMTRPQVKELLDARPRGFDPTFSPPPTPSASSENPQASQS